MLILTKSTTMMAYIANDPNFHHHTHFRPPSLPRFKHGRRISGSRPSTPRTITSVCYYAFSLLSWCVHVVECYDAGIWDAVHSSTSLPWIKHCFNIVHMYIGWNSSQSSTLCDDWESQRRKRRSHPVSRNVCNHDKMCHSDVSHRDTYSNVWTNPLILIFLTNAYDWYPVVPAFWRLFISISAL